MRKQLAAFATAATVGLMCLTGTGVAQASEPPGSPGGYACRVLHSAKKISSTELEFWTRAEGDCNYGYTVLSAGVQSGKTQVGLLQKFCNPSTDVNAATCMRKGIRMRIANPAGTQTFVAIGYFQWAASLSGSPKEGDYTKESFRL
ncbi:hypothetical protein [Pseudonocardia sp. GCM10023141]|uniref:hypothetical protein n=1 Tax=Pseudonocardia sp. GCM10023141 TaxID=3252653 RepID=UPI00360A7A95